MGSQRVDVPGVRVLRRKREMGRRERSSKATIVGGGGVLIRDVEKGAGVRQAEWDLRKKIGLRPGRASVDPGPAVRRDEIKIGCGELEGMIGGRQTDWVSRAELKGGQFLEFGDRVGGGENVRSAVGGGRSHRRVGEVNHSRIEALVILIEGRDVDFVLLEVGLEVGTD